MKIKAVLSILLISFVLPVFSQVKLEDRIFSYESITGIGYEKGITRRDPSDVIKVGNLDDTQGW